MKHTINRRKFLELFGCCCGSIMMGSCTTVPITDRKQLSLISESRINAQAASVYEKFKSKSKLITKGKSIKTVEEVGTKIQLAVSAFFNKENKLLPPIEPYDSGYIKKGKALLYLSHQYGKKDGFN